MRQYETASLGQGEVVRDSPKRDTDILRVAKRESDKPERSEKESRSYRREKVDRERYISFDTSCSNGRGHD